MCLLLEHQRGAESCGRVTKHDKHCCAESGVLPAVEMDVLLLWLRSHLVDFLLLHARCHHNCRVPVVPLQASAVLHHWG